MAKVNLARLAMLDAAADASQYAYEDWENAHLRDDDYEYPVDYPVISHRNLTQYAKPYRRSQQVVVGSRSTAYG